MRVVGATKVDLQEKVANNEFREDLFYRLNIIPIKLSPLRERKDDIPALVEHFLHKHGAEDGRPYITSDLMEKLINYDWPGNVRELENTVERIIALYELGTFEEQFLTIRKESQTKVPVSTLSRDKSYPAFQEYMKEREREIIEWAMKKANHNISRAAQLLQIPRSTLRSKMEKMGWADSQI